MCKGFVKIPRRLFETKWWNKKRIYSESDAIIDLYMSVDRKNTLTTSLRSLADRWIWDAMKVTRFLQRLEKDGYLTVEKTSSGTCIKICDFGTSVTQPVTPSDTASDTPKRPSTKDLNDVDVTPSDTPSVTPTVTLSRAYKNDNIISCLNGEEENNKNPLYIPPEGKKREKAFKKPSVEQIAEYISSKGYTFSAEAFYDFYESKGWMIGKNHMKDWQAACRTWNQKRKSENAASKLNYRPSHEDNVREVQERLLANIPRPNVAANEERRPGFP